MKENNQQLALLNKLVHIFDSSTDGLWYMGKDDTVQFYNSTFYEQFDLPLVNSVLEDWVKLMHPVDVKTFNARVKSHKEANTERMVSQYRVKTKEGQYIWIEATGIMVTENNETYMVGCHRDITEQKSLNENLSYAIYHERETGLFNCEKWESDISRCHPLSQGVIYGISIEHFYHYQRRWGIQVIHQIVEMLESGLQSFLPSGSKLYRVSPNVFVVWCFSPLSTDMTSFIGQSLKNLFVNDESSDCMVSADDIAIGIIHERDFLAQNALSLLLKTVKYARLNKKISMYTGDVKKNIDRYFAIIDALGDAISADQISIALQPIVDINSKKIISYEALARWTHSQLGMVRPDEFINIAEQQGHIATLGLSVLRKSCQFLVNYDQADDDLPSININVSVIQLLDGQFAQQAESIVRLVGLVPERVIFEITESHLLDFEKRGVEQLHVLHKRGFHLSLDDFGAGFSSLTSLFRLPLLQIKIDKDLVWGALSSKACRDLILYLVQHCQSHNIELLAEGIETPEMEQAMLDMGVSLIQGFGVYRPSDESVWLENKP
ncbi:EAL domain-containing protein [Psychromonas sp. KJ10-10]|uniref:EAL domain-containing protein n=1 Tax=Psychromonas sp. KJ10-10 TaxID=3391823 RepID=UPI0039B6A3F4